MGRRWQQGGRGNPGSLCLPVGVGTRSSCGGGLSPLFRLGSEARQGCPGNRAVSRIRVWLVYWPLTGVSVLGLFALHVHHPPGSEFTQLPHQVGMSFTLGLAGASLGPALLNSTSPRKLSMGSDFRLEVLPEGSLSCPSCCLQGTPVFWKFPDTCRYNVTSLNYFN